MTDKFKIESEDSESFRIEEPSEEEHRDHGEVAERK